MGNDRGKEESRPRLNSSIMFKVWPCASGSSDVCTREMNPAMHAYERLTLQPTGVLLGVVLVLTHAFLLLRPTASQRFLRAFPRNQRIGQLLLGLGFFWFWLLIAPVGQGRWSALAMDLKEFNGIKPMLRLFMPILFAVVAYSIREFLAVRALGFLGLLAAHPLLAAAFLKEPSSRLLIPLWTYAMIIAALFFVGMPYVFRDLVTWASSRSSRWSMLAGAGLVYGIAVLACALLFWK